MFEKTIVLPEETGRISTLFQMLQDLSGDAAAQWHASGDEMAEKGLMWVIVRYDVNLLRLPAPGEEIRLQTWANPVRHRMSQRNYLAFDAEGDCILQGAGSWAVVDYFTRSMVDPEERGIAIHGEINGMELPRPAAPRRLVLTDSSDYIVTDAVLDRNSHMNNTRYFDAVQDCMASADSNAVVKRVRALFISEARSGEQIHISWGKDGCNWFFAGEKNGDSCFQIGLEYA